MTTTTTATSATSVRTTAPTARRRLATRIGSGLAIAGAAAVLSFAGAGAASASTYGSFPLAPGQGACSVQYASYQVRVDAYATGQGAKFKVLRNGVVIESTPGRYSTWAAELRTVYGNFPGPGYYSLCAQNTGTTNTIVSLQVRSDSEF